MAITKTKYYNVYELWKGNRRILLTRNLTPGKNFFSERLHQEDSEEYREFDITRSKIAAAIAKKINMLPLRQGDTVLYLGAAHGYTASFVSDIVGKNGFVFCLDFAPRVVRDLYFVCEVRENMTPILANASHPETYKDLVSKADVLIQDIAQKAQVEILFKNLQFLKPQGYILFSVKARSIDVTERPSTVFKEVEQKLRTRLKILDKKDLSPLEKDHMIFLCQVR
ncbi:MAG TPA: fibrillarin-like rRNA/tRNA 2'-O-methyltransferase [Candidatus Nanoarchaeia archaeon]|nr:fibrillarin-like rRNA/tRNA 2'-O-methyltransferase [Candidatus Nanoarchaeia archaeon]